MLLVWPSYNFGATQEFSFDQYEIITGEAYRQTVLPGYLLGGAVAEIVVVSIDKNDNRRLRIFTFDDGTWVPMVDMTLRPGVLFVDVANIGGRDRLIMFERGKLNWFDPETTAEHPLVAVNSIYNAPMKGEVPHVDVTRDVNGDGRDDLLVPDFDGYSVFIQLSDGVFAAPVKLGPVAEMGMTVESNPWYQARPFHELDYNRDGLSDLVFWNENHFEVHYQDEQGLISAVAETSTPDVTFDSDGIYSITLGDSSEEEDTRQKVLRSLRDLNGDGVADLVTFTLEGRSVFGKQSAYEVHFGTSTPDGGTAFASEVDTALRSDGIQFDMEQHDFDGDGQIDMMITSFELGIGSIIRTLLTGSASLDLEFYRLEDGVYPNRPNVTRKIKAEFDYSTGNTFVPSVLIADLNDDGHADLLVQEDLEELRIFVGIPGPDLFSRRPQKVAVAMPDDEAYTWLVDLNKDGRPDLLMHHRSATESHRITMLIVR
ncbi:MAG: VCBS repeat-containing protein [Gammaproteobacteria bacterium]|nr:VCBS repeat-containing protein [Gammaproteobacteria bacterium]